MKMKFNLTIFLLCLISYTSISYAVERLPDNLINLTSKPGLALLKEDLNPNALKLLSHFTTQKKVTYCGVASIIMILNSSTLSPSPDSQHAPYQYFTQDDFFNDKVKTIVTPEEVQKKGITLTKLNNIIKSYGLKTDLYFANEINLEEFRKKLKTAISNQQFIIVNFFRADLKQHGGGHHSPIAAYDNKTDRFLLLDVARYKYPAYWVKAEDLWKAVNTTDGETYRGFIIITSP